MSEDDVDRETNDKWNDGSDVFVYLDKAFKGIAPAVVVRRKNYSLLRCYVGYSITSLVPLEEDTIVGETPQEVRQKLAERASTNAARLRRVIEEARKEEVEDDLD